MNQVKRGPLTILKITVIRKKAIIQVIIILKIAVIIKII